MLITLKRPVEVEGVLKKKTKGEKKKKKKNTQKKKKKTPRVGVE